MKKNLKEIVRLLGGIAEVYEQLNDKILFDLRNKTIEQLKKELKDDPADVHQYVYDLALKAEQYEICEAIRQLKS